MTMKYQKKNRVKTSWCLYFTNNPSIRQAENSVHLLFFQATTQIKPCHQLACCPGFKVWFVTSTIRVWTIRRRGRSRVKSTTSTTPCRHYFFLLLLSSETYHTGMKVNTWWFHVLCLSQACVLFFVFLCHVRISGMLIELQTLLADRSILNKARLLADDIDQWNSVLQSNPGDGKEDETPKSW